MWDINMVGVAIDFSLKSKDTTMVRLIDVKYQERKNFFHLTLKGCRVKYMIWPGYKLNLTSSQESFNQEKLAREKWKMFPFRAFEGFILKRGDSNVTKFLITL